MTSPVTPGANPVVPATPAVPAPPATPPAPVPTPPAQTAPGVPAGQSTPTDPNAPLGEGGMRALQSERELRKAADTARAAAEAELATLRARDMTEVQRAEATSTEWQRKYAELESTNRRNTIALEFGITGADLVMLTGKNEDELRAQATWVKSVVERTPATVVPAFAATPAAGAGNAPPPAPASTVESGRALYAARNNKS